MKSLSFLNSFINKGIFFSIRNLFTLLRISLLIFFFPISIFSIERIDLVNDCVEVNSCKPHIWHLEESFNPESIQSESINPNSIKVEKFPILIKKIFPATTSNDFTLSTEFTVSDEYIADGNLPGISIGAIADVYSIYLNGRLIGKEGIFQDGKSVYSRYGKNLKYPLSVNYFKKGKNKLVIHLQGNPKFYLTGLFNTSGYYLDDYNKILIETRDRTGIILIFLYLFVGAYHLFLFIKRRNEKYNLFFSLFTLFTFIYMLTRSGIFFEYGWDSTIVYRMELGSVYFIGPFLGIFLENLFFGRIGLYFRIYFGLCSFLFISVLVLPQTLLEYSLRFWQVNALISFGFYFFTFYKAIKQKSESAKRLFVGFTVLIIFTFYDILDSIFFKTGVSLNRYAFFAFVIGIVAILADRFLNLHQTVEDLNKNLENKVQTRTLQLQESLQEIKLLKEQQDGDYFLTTLIIEPLASKIIDKNDPVDIKILTHQKKKFEFKKQIHEIGGDICIAENIYLKGRKYTAFVNGDAMGKSIQGAGGALALGVVFKSILSRTKLFSIRESVFPERWIKHAYQELQSIFESFDGSMMVSVVMGLIDVELGFIYFVNAEHPFCVLYRDKKATFLETETSIRKIGMMTAQSEFSFKVNTFKLENKDIVLIGSDGRDDIKLGVDKDGNRIINEDEKLFLKTVEEAEGDLEKIFSLTQNIGELTDDFSLLKIEFNDSYISKAQTNSSDLEKAVECLHRKEYGKAAELYSRSLVLLPDNKDILYEAAKCYQLSGDYELAADYSERLRLRDPMHLQNLILLIEIYLELKQNDRAERILKLAFCLDNENTKLLALQKQLQSQSLVNG